MESFSFPISKQLLGLFSLICIGAGMVRQEDREPGGGYDFFFRAQSWLLMVLILKIAFTRKSAYNEANNESCITIKRSVIQSPN